MRSEVMADQKIKYTKNSLTVNLNHLHSYKVHDYSKPDWKIAIEVPFRNIVNPSRMTYWTKKIKEDLAGVDEVKISSNRDLVIIFSYFGSEVCERIVTDYFIGL